LSVVVIGANGSMGQRYQAIFRYLNHGVHCLDAQHSISQIREAVKAAQGVVIATPTDTHAALIRELAPLRKPILCEKPVTKDMGEMEEIRALLKDTGTPFRMMYQYSVLADPTRIGRSSYNYFRHGGDGLIWDCLQIIGLSRGIVNLREDSPVWSCVVNGQTLNLRHMDAAYIAYVQTWFKIPGQSLDFIQGIHEKTHDFARRHPYGQ
jgi:hypothetical protein